MIRAGAALKGLPALVISTCLTACFPGNEGQPDATAAQIETILNTCGVTKGQVEPQDEGIKRFIVSIDPRETDKARKVNCLLEEQKKIGADFAIFGG